MENIMADENKPAEGNQPPIAEPKGDDVQAMLAAALKAEREKWDAEAAAKRAADKEAAEIEEAKKRGEFEQIAAKEKARADAAEARIASREREDAIRRAVSFAGKEQQGYDGELFQTYVADHLVLKLAPDATAEQIAKAAKEGVEKYVADNAPKQQKAGGAPASQRPGARAPATSPATNPDARTTRRRYGSAYWNG